MIIYYVPKVLSSITLMLNKSARSNANLAGFSLDQHNKPMDSLKI